MANFSDIIFEYFQLLYDEYDFIKLLFPVGIGIHSKLNKIMIDNSLDVKKNILVLTYNEQINKYEYDYFIKNNGDIIKETYGKKLKVIKLYNDSTLYFTSLQIYNRNMNSLDVKFDLCYVKIGIDYKFYKNVIHNIKNIKKIIMINSELDKVSYNILTCNKNKIFSKDYINMKNIETIENDLRYIKINRLKKNKE